MEHNQNGGFCPKCGKPHAAGAAFCPGCGASLQVAPAPQPKQQYVPPKPQYTPPQPQYTPPQPQYAPPQPQYAPPQPQYAPPQPQYAPQPQYSNTQAVPVVKQKKLWQTICSIMLLVSVLLIMVLPTMSFYKFSYKVDGIADDKDLKDTLEEANEEMEPVSILDMLTEDEYSIIKAFETFEDRIEYIDMMAEYADSDYVFSAILDAIFDLLVSLVVFVLAIIFLISTLVYAIKAIIAMCKSKYDALVKCSLSALARLITTFISLTVYTNMYANSWDEETIIRGGIGMAPLTAMAVYGAAALILGAMIVSMVMNREVALSAAKRANTIKSITAFVGTCVIAFIMLSQKAQYLFTATYRVFYPNSFDADDAFLKFILVIGTLVIYTTVASKLAREIEATGKEGLYFSNLTQAEIDTGSMKRGSAPNILANAIFFLFITAAVYVYESEFEFFILNPTALIIMTVISVATYIAYKVLGSVFSSKNNQQPNAPQQNVAYYNSQNNGQYYQ